MDAQFWNARYVSEEYAYGEEPNKFLVQCLHTMKPGKILFPADGEGRNSVYAATQGWESYAFDQSSEGKRKAELLAAKHNVAIQYEVAEMPAVAYTENEFDAIALIFAHFSGNEKQDYLKQLSSFLKPGGTVIFEAYSKSHVKFKLADPGVGGPADVQILYSTAELEEAFQGFEVIQLKEEDLEIREGSFHGGMSSVVRFIGRKR